MTPSDVISGLLLGGGAFVALTSAIGVLRLPDFFSRVHPAGENESLAHTLILAGLMVSTGPGLVALKLFLLWLFLMLLAPATGHAITRAAWNDGRRPWSARPPRADQAGAGAGADGEMSP